MAFALNAITGSLMEIFLRATMNKYTDNFQITKYLQFTEEPDLVIQYKFRIVVVLVNIPVKTSMQSQLFKAFMNKIKIK